MIKISPSILSCDFSHLGEEVLRTASAGADYLHIDVMDGAFVPNITLGPCVISAIRRYTSLPFDVHLMIKDPLRYIDAFADAGADILTIHEESCENPGEVLRYIRRKGIKASLSIKPGTSPEKLRPFLPLCDMILIMSVEPGFGGQSFLSHTLAHMREAKKMIEESGLQIDLEADGGITAGNAAEVAAAGVGVLVAGSAVYRADDIRTAIAEIRANAEAAFEKSKR